MFREAAICAGTHDTTHGQAWFVLDFFEISLRDRARVDGKNSSLGELFGAPKPKAVGVLDRFATTADAYWLPGSTRFR